MQLHLHWLLTESWFWIIPELIFSEFINWNTSWPFRLEIHRLRSFFKFTVDLNSDWLIRLTDQNPKVIFLLCLPSFQNRRFLNVFFLEISKHFRKTLIISVKISCWWQCYFGDNIFMKIFKCLWLISWSTYPAAPFEKWPIFNDLSPKSEISQQTANTNS